MKKFLLTALFMLSLAGVSHAGGELRSTPRGDPQALATADYGGVMQATNSFNTNLATVCFPCSGVFYGVMFTTGAYPFNLPPDFVDVFDSTDARIALLGTDATMRLNNMSQWVGSTTTAAGFSGPPKPVRFSKGLFFKSSSVNYNGTSLLFYKEP